MKYDFTTVPNRTDGTSMKWNQMKEIKPDVSPGVVPLSTADMEFFNAPEIMEEIKAYLDTHVLGYTNANDAYYDAVIKWQKRRHNFEIEKEWIIESPGVVPAMGTAIEAYTEPGDGVVLLTPIYFPMTLSITVRNRRIVESPLLLTENGYEIDFEDFEKKCEPDDVKLMFLCSPHNPVGRVWTKEELTKIVDICVRNHVFILSDEIHNDLIMPGYTHTVLATVSEEAAMNCAVCTAPSKTFSLAGMQTSNIIIKNPVYRAAFQAQLLANFTMSLNALGYVACRAAYEKCEDWLDECISVIEENAKYVEEFMAEHFPQCKVYPLQGTYLQWVDFRSFGLTHVELEKFMQQEAQIFMDEGYMFGKAARGFERFNLACPTQVIKDTMQRLYDAYVRCKDSWEKEGKLDHVALKVSEKMTDFIYSTPFESGKDFLIDVKGKKCLLIFSRYYSCGLCQNLLAELEENKKLLEEKNMVAKVVMQSPQEMVKAGLGETNPYSFEIICDQEQKLYQKFEVFPGGSMDIMGNPKIKEIMVHNAENAGNVPAEGNEMQYPAAFIINEEGIITYSYYSNSMLLPSVRQMID